VSCPAAGCSPAQRCWHLRAFVCCCSFLELLESSQQLLPACMCIQTGNRNAQQSCLQECVVAAGMSGIGHAEHIAGTCETVTQSFFCSFAAAPAARGNHSHMCSMTWPHVRHNAISSCLYNHILQSHTSYAYAAYLVAARRVSLHLSCVELQCNTEMR
jgi:hypothetical protein